MADMELYLGDCVQVMRERIADESIDLTVTSPPYDKLRTYNGYVFDFEATARELWRVTKPGGVVVWVVADQTVDGSETLTSFTSALYFRSLGFNVETMIYEVETTGAKGCNYLYWQSFEYMFILMRGRPKTSNRLRDKPNIKSGSVNVKSVGGRSVNKYGKRSSDRFEIQPYGYRGNVWRYFNGNASADDKTEHPAPFPEKLARDHILSWSNPGDVVLDCFMGSGTTGKMAKLLHRNFIGIDISEEYCNIAAKRIAETQAPAITEEGVFVQPEQAPLFEVV